MAIGTGIGMIAGGLIGGGTSLLGARAANRGNQRASDTQAKADADALQFAKEQEAARRAEFDKTLEAEERRWQSEQEQNRALFEEDQLRYADEQAYRNPRREAGHGALTNLASLIGVKVPAYQQPRDPYASGGGSGRVPIGSVGARPPMNTTMPVDVPTYSGGASFSAMVPRFAPVDPRRSVPLKRLAGY